MKSCRILCVHTGPELEELRDLLEGNGYEVVPASDGNKAMDVLTSQPVDAVVLDFDLSTRGGCSLRNRIQHASPGLPMLLFRDVQEVKQLPLRVFSAYLNRPDSPDAVLAHLRN